MFCSLVEPCRPHGGERGLRYEKVPPPGLAFRSGATRFGLEENNRCATARAAEDFRDNACADTQDVLRTKTGLRSLRPPRRRWGLYSNYSGSSEQSSKKCSSTSSSRPASSSSSCSRITRDTISFHCSSVKFSQHITFGPFYDVSPAEFWPQGIATTTLWDRMRSRSRLFPAGTVQVIQFPKPV